MSYCYYPGARMSFIERIEIIAIALPRHKKAAAAAAENIAQI